jgi:predicted HTH domain antitoxin
MLNVPPGEGIPCSVTIVTAYWSASKLAVMPSRTILPPEVPIAEAKLLLTAKLYETGRLSLGQAARLAGYSKRAFMELLGTLGVSVLDYPAEELKAEVES